MKQILLLVVILCITSCSFKLPPLTNIKTDQIKKIGIAMYVDENPKHVHIGTTIFTNFQKDLPLKLPIEKKMVEHLSSCIQRMGREAVIVDTKKYPQEIITNLITFDEKSWLFMDTSEEPIRQLKTDYDIDALLVMDQTYACIMSPCEINRAWGYGLFTRSMFGSSKHYAFHSIRPIIYYLNQPGSQSVMDGINPKFNTPLLDDKNLDKEKLKEQDLGNVKIAVEAYLGKMLAATCDSLLPTSKSHIQ